MTIDLSRIKSYAPKARRDFIAAVANRAAKFGITANGSLDAQVTGNVVIIGGQAHPKTVAHQRERLLGRIAREGYQEVMEQIAYTWFNRLAALRFLEVNDYLGHAFLVLSARPNPNGIEDPEILTYAEELEFSGLEVETIKSLKLDGNRDEEIYRLVLVAQCNALHARMPFLFEKIGDETELLLPDGLLATDGLIRKLVTSIPTNSWKEIEIIGWLYQFYISEKKDQIFAALKKNQKIIAENIPAATQLFTPHWIVRYLVENSLGRLWLLNNPHSRLAGKMEYYIESEEAEPDILRISKPEDIRFCDPACGSGHMLTYAFDLMYEIYEERGYDAAEIPELILKHNLTGIEIDDRAGALAAFALAMKAAARLGQRRFLKMNVRPHIVILQDVKFTDAEMTRVAAVLRPDLFTDELRQTLAQFEKAKNFGSLIIPKLRELGETLRVVEASGTDADLMAREIQERLATVLHMADALSPKYHVVVANPPYMGTAAMNPALKKFVADNYKKSKPDVGATFIERCQSLCSDNAIFALITMQGWMFLSRYEELRASVLQAAEIVSLAHLGERAFDSIGGAVVSTAAFVLRNSMPTGRRGTFIRLTSGNSEAEKSRMLRRIASGSKDGIYFRKPLDFEKVPGGPISYWLPERTLAKFSDSPAFGELLDPRKGLVTANNKKYVRMHWEVSCLNTGRGFSNRADARVSGAKWFPYNKGGERRKWFGNDLFVVDWENDGWEMQNTPHPNEDRIWATNFNLDYIFQSALTWSDITTEGLVTRITPTGSLFDDTGKSAFLRGDSKITLEYAAGLTNTKVGNYISQVLNPTLHFLSGDFARFPCVLGKSGIEARVQRAVEIAAEDWTSFEIAPGFASLPLLSTKHCPAALKDAYESLRAYWQDLTDEMQLLEEANNSIFIESYDLQDELCCEVSAEEITLTCNPIYRYGAKLSKESAEDRLRQDTVKELVSYSIGCMMGRYSLVKPGLVYANAGGIGFDPAVYAAFAADDDGVIPVTDRHWFDDDGAVRFAEFLKVACDGGILEENLRFVADNLSPKRGEAPVETIRRYISRSFFKDHLQTYRTRPIYWLFSSGPERAFECLVYQHRFNDLTLPRMRAKYVTALQSRMQNRLESLKLPVGEIRSSAAEKNRVREVDILQRQLHELSEFDDRLRQAMERNIKLRLDDGVRANYMKLRELLADADVVIGKKGDGDDE